MLTKLDFLWTIFWTSESCVTCFSAPDGSQMQRSVDCPQTNRNNCHNFPHLQEERRVPFVYNPNETTVTTFPTYSRNDVYRLPHRCPTNRCHTFPHLRDQRKQQNVFLIEPDCPTNGFRWHFFPPTGTRFGSVTKESCDFLEIGRIARNRTESPEIRHFAHKSHGVTTCSNESVLDQKSVEIETKNKKRQILRSLKLKSLKRKAPNGRRMGRQNTRFFGSPIVPGKDF